MKNIISNEHGHCRYCVCEDKNCSMIYNLFVKEEYRRKGVAKHFLQEVIEEIRTTGYISDIKIIAEPEENSISKEDLVKFYEKMGLKVICL